MIVGELAFLPALMGRSQLCWEGIETLIYCQLLLPNKVTEATTQQQLDCDVQQDPTKDIEVL
jgi:hypothetical protein